MLERTVERYLVERVRAMGGTAYKWQGGGGVADRVVCLPNGVTWFVEVKTAGGRLSPLQTAFRDNMHRLGQHYSVVWSKEDVDTWAQIVSAGSR